MLIPQTSLHHLHSSNLAGSDLLGGLLSAFALTKNKIFKEKANEVGKVIVQSMTSHADRMPRMHPSTPDLITVGDGYLAELTYLSRITGYETHRNYVREILHFLGALPSVGDDFAADRLNVTSLTWQGGGQFTSVISVWSFLISYHLEHPLHNTQTSTPYFRRACTTNCCAWS